MVYTKADHIQADHEQHIPSGNIFPLVFLAHDINTPENVGSLFRIADALGVKKIYLSGDSICPPNTKLRKTSRACEKFIPFSYEKNPEKIVHELKSRAYQLISIEITDNSIDIAKLKINPQCKVCLVLGSEQHGVAKTLLDLSDAVVHIPMLGMNSSMNVANACSIATYLITQKLVVSGSVE